MSSSQLLGVVYPFILCSFIHLSILPSSNISSVVLMTFHGDALYWVVDSFFLSSSLCEAAESSFNLSVEEGEAERKKAKEKFESGNEMLKTLERGSSTYLGIYPHLDF